MNLSLPESCFLAVEEKIKSLESSTQALKLHRNTLVPISGLPTEILSFIFSILPPSPTAPSPISHVCHRWREVSLKLPYLWSHIDFTKLTLAGAAEMLARAEMVPLHLEAQTTRWSKKKFKAFEEQIEAHIHHTRHLSIAATSQYLRRTFKRLPLAPSLEHLSIARPYREASSVALVIPDDIFDGIAPKLIYPRLDNCGIGWNSPLFKNLRDLRLFSFPVYARTTLNTWLDALKQMQLERLTLHGGIPIRSVNPEPVELGLTAPVVLSSLTELDISASARDCLAMLGPLVLPALGRLSVDAQTDHPTGRDELYLILYIAQNAHGLQDTEPHQSLLIGGSKKRSEIVAWTMPRQDTTERLCSSVDFLDGIRLRVAFSTINRDWLIIRLCDAVLTGLPLGSTASVTVEGRIPLNRQVWRRHAQRWHKLERVRLRSTAVPTFREMLEDALRGGTLLLPSLKEIVLVDVSLDMPKVYYLRDMLVKLVKLEIPLRRLDLRTCIVTSRAVQFLSKIVGNLHDPVNRESENAEGKRRGGIEVLGEGREGGSDGEEHEFNELPPLPGSWDTDDDDGGDDDDDESDDDDDDDDETSSLESSTD